ncbi:MAG: hypothetical protein H6R47_1158 [Proteobacteria bacterium]|jgi:hypothetical protein|nr:hypothetical protein [Pseudomonadota bacterium]
MPFTIKGANGIDDATARQRVMASFAYLKRSPLARSILEDLEKADVCIEVDPTAEPFFAHPESSYATITTGGTAVWNPNMSLKTIDSERWRGHDGGSYKTEERKTNPNAAWVPKHTERAPVILQKRGIALRLAKAFNLSRTRTVTRNVPAAKTGTLSAHMCLLHELGHALQYATYRQHFLDIKNTSNSAHAQESLEETNLQCVEIPVALELRALGADETPRWIYGHTAT